MGDGLSCLLLPQVGSLTAPVLGLLQPPLKKQFANNQNKKKRGNLDFHQFSPNFWWENEKKTFWHWVCWWWCHSSALICIFFWKMLFLLNATLPSSVQMHGKDAKYTQKSESWSKTLIQFHFLFQLKWKAKCSLLKLSAKERKIPRKFSLIRKIYQRPR